MDLNKLISNSYGARFLHPHATATHHTSLKDLLTRSSTASCKMELFVEFKRLSVGSNIGSPVLSYVTDTVASRYQLQSTLAMQLTYEAKELGRTALSI